MSWTMQLNLQFRAVAVAEAVYSHMLVSWGNRDPISSLDGLHGSDWDPRVFSNPWMTTQTLVNSVQYTFVLLSVCTSLCIFPW